MVEFVDTVARGAGPRRLSGFVRHGAALFREYICRRSVKEKGHERDCRSNRALGVSVNFFMIIFRSDV